VGLEQLLVAGLLSVVAGVLGSLLGLGGGLFITPLLSGLLGMPVHRAVAASIIAVIATSSSGGSGYLRRELPNVRLAMVLETGAVLGAIVGTVINGVLSAKLLSGIFALVLIYTAISLLSRTEPHQAHSDPLAMKLGLCDAYPISRVRLGLVAAVFAGIVSGLLGIGGGIIMVPVMVTWMGVPLRNATATSTFMIGITGLASAIIQFAHGQVDVVLAAPVILGVFAGAALGPSLAPKISPSLLRVLFLAAIGLSSAQMALRTVGR